MSTEHMEYHNFQAQAKRGFDNQIPNILVEFSTKLQSFPGINNKFLTVSMVGTQVAASLTKKMAFDSDTNRGWFTEEVEVIISLSDKNITIRATAPDTASETTSISHSSSSGFSGGIGTFNGDPTANLSFSSNSSTSYAQAVPDFKLSNLSDLNNLHHVYSLSSIPEGGYSGPFSLENKPDAGHAIGDLFQFKAPQSDYHVRLKRVTDNDGRAICNLPTPSQAVFMTPNGQYKNKVSLYVAIKHKLAKVSESDGFPKDHIQAQQKIHTFCQQIEVDFSQVDDQNEIRKSA